jgi:ferrous iron transport protein B
LLPAGEYTLVDLPGIYALANQEASLDEQIASRFVQRQQPDLLLNVIDAANLERSLYLTLQLRELGLPMVVVLNKMDLLQKRRITIDEALLAKALGCPVVSLSAHNRQQVAAFKGDPPVYRPVPARPGARLRSAPRGTSPSWRLCSPPSSASPWPRPAPAGGRHRHAGDPGGGAAGGGRQRGEPRPPRPGHRPAIADLRYGHIHHWCQQACRHQDKLTVAQSERLDRVLLNRWVGILLPAGDVPDVHVRHQGGQRLHRLFRHPRGPCSWTECTTCWG